MLKKWSMFYASLNLIYQLGKDYTYLKKYVACLRKEDYMYMQNSG